MERKEFWVPLAVVGLTALFALVSLLVRATRGRSHWLIRRKLAVGATLLSLTWAASGCSDDGGPTVTCYAPALPDNQIYYDQEQYTNQGLELDLAEGSALTGTIEQRTADRYSFLVLDADLQQVTSGTIVAADGAYDEFSEAFIIDLGSGVPAGTYQLVTGVGTPDDVAVDSGDIETLVVLAPAP